MKYWLFKSEPDKWSWEDQKAGKCEEWDGIRNYQARNFMREMKKGDLGFFYHSNIGTGHVHAVIGATGQAPRMADHMPPGRARPQNPQAESLKRSAIDPPCPSTGHCRWTG